MAPIRKVDEGLDGLMNERYSNLRKVKRKDYQDFGGSQRQFQELVDEFNTEDQRRDAGKDQDRDKVDIEERNRRRAVRKDSNEQLTLLQNKASHRAKKPKDDDEDVGGKLDING